MSRWYLTNSAAADARACDAAARAGLRRCGRVAEDDAHGEAYFKRSVDTPTFAVAADDCWIFCAGVLMLGGLMGTGALVDFVGMFLEYGIAAARAAAQGHYAVVIGHEGRITAFTDELGACTLYYGESNGQWMLSTSLSLCAGSLPGRAVEPTTRDNGRA